MNWDKVYESGREFTPVSEIVLDNVFNVTRNKTIKDILDVGCGRGQLIKQLECRGFEVDGIDLSKHSSHMVGDFMKKDLPKYDMIVANKVIAFNKPEEFINKVQKTLNKNGVFVCITPVLYAKYQDKYNQKLQSISIDSVRLDEILWSKFENVKIIDTRHFDDYGVELTYVCS